MIFPNLDLTKIELKQGLLNEEEVRAMATKATELSVMVESGKIQRYHEAYEHLIPQLTEKEAMVILQMGIKRIIEQGQEVEHSDPMSQLMAILLKRRP